VRALERRVLRLLDEGVSEQEIARRFRRTPEMIGRIAVMARLPRASSGSHEPHSLRPLERRILSWRARGAAYGEIGARFRRSADHVERVEGLARYKLNLPD
jgi:DNA-binding CsgD family transcriptional regulator